MKTDAFKISSPVTTRSTVSPRAFPSSCRSWYRSCSTPTFFSAKTKQTQIQKHNQHLRLSKREERTICGAVLSQDLAYLAVEHLISRHAVQLHAEKVVPGEGTEKKRERCSEIGSLPTLHHLKGCGWSQGEPWRRASHGTAGWEKRKGEFDFSRANSIERYSNNISAVETLILHRDENYDIKIFIVHCKYSLFELKV